jgi:RNA 3'-terminal phosphate cyclase (ATP)
VKVREGGKVGALNIIERGPLKSLKVRGAVSNLDDGIAERMIRAVKYRAREVGVVGKVFKGEVYRPQSENQGAYVFIQADFENARACFTGLGSKGKRAEIVAAEAWDGALDYIGAEGALEPHIADQSLLPLSVAEGESEFTTTKITSHLLTNAAVIEAFGAAKIDIEGEESSPGRVKILPKSDIISRTK